MGHRTSLAIRRDTETHIQVFETNNSFAIFWLTLLTVADIDGITAVWKQLENTETDEPAPDFDVLDPNYETALEADWVVLDAAVAIGRARNRRPAIGFFLPASLRLFDDWLAYLTAITRPDDWQLIVDIWQYANFSDTNTFGQQLIHDLQLLDNPTGRLLLLEGTPDSPDGLTGWESNIHRPFSKRAASYRNLVAVAAQLTQQQAEMAAQKGVGLSMGYGFLLRFAIVGIAFFFFPFLRTIYTAGIAMLLLDLLVAFDVITKPAVLRRMFKWRD